MREELIKVAQDALDANWRENHRMMAIAVVDAILAALEKEPADPGIPVYRLRDGTEDVLGEG